MYVLHIRILRVLSGLLIISLIRNLILKLNYNSKGVSTKYQTTCIQVGRPSSPVSLPYNCKRTMSTFSKSIPVTIYANPDKDKELIVNENKGRTGIYRWVHIESGKSYIGSSGFFSITRPYSTLNNNDTNSQTKKSLIPAAIYPEAYINKTIILNDNKNKAGVYR